MSDEYDEFGNFLGEAGSDVDSDLEAQDEPYTADGYLHAAGDGALTLPGQLPHAMESAMDISTNDENRIVLAEDKKYYLDANEVYPGAKTILMDEDTQGIDEPIIKSVKAKNFSVLEKDGEIPTLNYSTDFMATLMETPSLIRNVAIVGQFHHGKTVLMDTLIRSTQETGRAWANINTPNGGNGHGQVNGGKDVRYSDTRTDEQARELSIKSTLVSLVAESVSTKSYLCHFLDCPGHVNFLDEMEAALRVVDGAVLVVDAIEGVMLSTRRAIRACIKNNIAITLCISKLDRLILELKIPPQDAYYKLQHIIGEVNSAIGDALLSSSSGAPRTLISPAKGNVCFSSGQHGWSFTLESFAAQYCSELNKSAASENQSNGSRGKQSTSISVSDLARRLWGDWYWDPVRGSISKKPPSNGASRTFVQLILEPLYKIYSHVLGDEPQDLVIAMKSVCISISQAEAQLDPKPLLSCALRKFFGKPTGIVSMIVQHVPSPLEASEMKVKMSYASISSSRSSTQNKNQNEEALPSMIACRADGPLVMHVTKLYNTPDGKVFHALARIYSGTIQNTGTLTVRVLGEAFSEVDQEDISTAVVDGVSVSVGRFSISVPYATAGNLVLIEGIDAPILKSATVFASAYRGDFGTFSKLTFDNIATVRLAVEALRPADLPKLVDALRRVCKSYPLVTTKVEESGEHVIMAPGELSMDCVMHDLRFLYSDIEVRVADPVVSFCETVMETSALKCSSYTPNKKNMLSIIAEPLDRGLGYDIEFGALRSQMFIPPSNVLNGGNQKDFHSSDEMSHFLQKKYGWDLLSSRSIWSFGPDDTSPNLFLNDTLPSEVDTQRLLNVKESIVQGFKWATREGPLCDEMIREVKFKILDANIASESIYRGGGQIIPTARRIIYSSFLTAAPRLMEPIYSVEVQAPADVVQAVQTVLSRRRGRVISDMPKAGAPFYVMKAYIPVLESFGFEADLRSYTQGQAFGQLIFDHWALLPGDPLDGDVILHPLEPSPPRALARDCMVKTRRRKGLSDDVSISKYFDDEMLEKIRQQQ